MKTALTSAFLLLGHSARAVSLEEAIALAEGNASAVQLAVIQRRQTELMTARAIATLSPRIIAQGAYTRNQQEIAFDMSESLSFLESIPELPGWEAPDLDMAPTIIQPLSRKAGSITVSQTLMDAQMPLVWKSARSQADAARHAEEETRSRIQQQALSLYSQSYLLSEASAVAEEAVDIAGHRLERIQAEVSEGQSRPQELLQAKLDLQRARRELLEAGEGKEKAIRDLEALINQPAGDLQPLPAPPALPPLAELTERALANRSELRQSRSELDAISALHKSKSYQWLPLLEGSYSHSYSDNIAFSDLNTQWRFDLQAQWTLWDGGFRLLDQREQLLRLEAQALLLEEQEGLVERDLADLWSRSQRESVELGELRAQVALARHNLEVAELALSTGEVREETVLEARWLLHQAGWLERQADESLKRSQFLLHAMVGEDLGAEPR